jgi:hypothetical protein
MNQYELNEERKLPYLAINNFTQVMVDSMNIEILNTKIIANGYISGACVQSYLSHMFLQIFILYRNEQKTLVNPFFFWKKIMEYIKYKSVFSQETKDMILNNNKRSKCGEFESCRRLWKLLNCEEKLPVWEYEYLKGHFNNKKH